MSSTMRGLRVATLALVAIAVFAAGVLSSCAANGCCVKDADASLHRAMPCCDEPTVASGEAIRLLPATFSASVPPPQKLAIPVAAIATPPPSIPNPPQVQATLAAAASAHARPDLFLRNEQFRI